MHASTKGRTRVFSGTTNPLPRRAAFSLIEMAVVMAIVGMMTGYAIRYSQASEAQSCYTQTAAQLSDIRQALNRFIAAQGRLPLPAGRSMGVTDTAYGQEAMDGNNPTIDHVVGPPDALIGALPFTTLGLAPDAAGDCWGNKFTYAVTTSMTNAAGYASTNGSLEIRAGTIAAHSLRAADATYAVISHGASALGASAENYRGAKKNCNAATAATAITRIDKENCDVGNAIFYASDFNDGQNMEYFFDDLVIYASKPRLVIPANCDAGIVTWGTNCAAPALTTLAGLTVSLANTRSGYTGVALSICNAGARTTLGTCLPVGTCSFTSPRDGTAALLLTGISMNYGIGLCKKYSCCNGAVGIGAIFPCASPLDLPGVANGC